jgi:hypothetical protein
MKIEVPQWLRYSDATRYRKPESEITYPQWWTPLTCVPHAPT